MRIPTGSIVMACALSVALLVAGCFRPGVRAVRLGEELYLLPAAARGPDPFTGSTVTGATAPGPPDAGGTTAPGPRGVGATGPPLASSSGPALPAALVAAPGGAVRVLSGATPGLYGGTAGVAGCDVERQIGYLTADRARGDAFARAAGVPASGLPGYLRGLTPVVLRADTRVTSHGYRAGQAVVHQAVLQAGTAVLVDDRGVPRVRCACGNPLGRPAPARAGLGARGSAWNGYRPGQVIAVTPAPRAVTTLTIVNAETRTWIQRRIGHDVRHDRVVPAPAGATAALPRPRRNGPVPPPDTTGRPPAALATTAPDPLAPRTTPPPDRPPPPLGITPDPPLRAGPLDGSGPRGGLSPSVPSDRPAAPMDLPDG